MGERIQDQRIISWIVERTQQAFNVKIDKVLGLYRNEKYWTLYFMGEYSGRYGTYKVYMTRRRKANGKYEAFFRPTDSLYMKKGKKWIRVTDFGEENYVWDSLVG